MKIKEWLIVNKWSLVVWGTICLGTSFLGFLGGRFIPVDIQEPVKKDTVYVGNGYADSLLLDISNQVREINKKIPFKKTRRRSKTRKDTIHIDASVNISSNQE